MIYGVIPEVFDAYNTATVSSLNSLDGVPTVCGGLTSESGVLNQCYYYDAPTDYWYRAGKMTSRRAYAGYSLHPTKGLIITGGQADSDVNLHTVESTTDGYTFDTNYDEMLEDTNYGHCQVTVDDNTVMVFGGVDTETRAERLDLTTGSWHRVTNIPREYKWHGWGVTRDETGPLSVLVAGGHLTSTNRGNTIVEVWDLATSTWREGTNE